MPMTPADQSQQERGHGPARRVVLQSFQAADLAELVAFWNITFANRRNFAPITERSFRERVLECPAFDASGLILAWEHVGSQRALAGIAHAFRPAPQSGLYLAWPRKHELALLYVRPESRRMGVGTRLLQAAESWLYYCPVYVASMGQPCYGGVEGPRAPFFGSSEHMAISVRDSGLLHFLSKRGYQAFDPGNVSMTLQLAESHARVPAFPASATQQGLRPVWISHTTPFTGFEPDDRRHYQLLGNNRGHPYTAIGLVDHSNTLVAHLTWFPLAGHNSKRAAITNVRVAPEFRGDGLGSWLLDQALYEIKTAPWPAGGYEAVELNTHLVHFATAVGMYERRGFVVDDAWVTLVKT